MQFEVHLYAVRFLRYIKIGSFMTTDLTMPQRERSTFLELLHQARLIIVLLLGGFLGVFALQNMARVELTFLIWTFESRRVIVIAVSMLVGLVVGWLFGFAFGRRS